jgi:cell division septum initiation protein DivIVA
LLELKEARRGAYDRVSTDELLSRLFESYEGLWMRCQALIDELERAEQEASVKSDSERRLRQTLLTAAVAADKYKQHARRDAEIVLKKARAKAGELVAEAESRRKAVEAEAADLAGRKEEARGRYETFLREGLMALQAELDRLTAGSENGRGDANVLPEALVEPSHAAGLRA